jgi:hypothetical protein
MDKQKENTPQMLQSRSVLCIIKSAGRIDDVRLGRVNSDVTSCDTEGDYQVVNYRNVFSSQFDVTDYFYLNL